MKLKLYLVFMSCFIVQFVHGQSFIYDQQSSTNPDSAHGGGRIQDLAPMGQSFMPTFTSIKFVQLAFYDLNAGNSQGVSIYLNLRTNSITGTILASTAPVFMPDSFGIGGGAAEVTNFFFASAINLTPDAVYCLELIVQSGDSWAVSTGEYNYPRGSVISHGAPVGDMSDLWFREGIVAVPEPSSVLLGVLGGWGLAWRCRKR